LRLGKRRGEVAVVPVAHQPSSLQKVRPVWTARRSIGRLLPATADDNGGGKSSQACLPKGHVHSPSPAAVGNRTYGLAEGFGQTRVVAHCSVRCEHQGHCSVGDRECPPIITERASAGRFGHARCPVLDGVAHSTIIWRRDASAVAIGGPQIRRNWQVTPCAR